jgi:hypothetical protein
VPSAANRHRSLRSVTAAPELPVLRLAPDAAAAFNGFSQRHLYGAISASGDSTIPITWTMNAAIESLRPGSLCDSMSGHGARW